MILDEATNALDPQTETTILARLMALQPKPTLVIIAHRPDTLNACDRVLTMTDGRLA
jgi:ATP-binding cassette subfamily C protein